MKRETAAAEELYAAGRKAQYDEHVKRLLSVRQILAVILQKAVAELEGYSAEELAAWIAPDVRISDVPLGPGQEGYRELRIVGDNVEDHVPREGKLTYDIRFRVHIPGRDRKGAVQMLIDLEAQKDPYPGHPLVCRGIFYGARMISAQKGTEFLRSQYGKIRRSCSIWICMNAPKKIGDAMTEYRMVPQERIGHGADVRENYDKLSVIMIHLDKRPISRPPRSLHRFLYTLLSPKIPLEEKKRILSEEYHIRMEEEMEKEMKEMCNLSEAIEESGIKKGRREGRKEGRREGRRAGRIEGERTGKKEGEAQMSRLILALIQDGKEALLAQVASDDAVRERMYREYHI